MEDEKIIDLYWARSEDAISQTRTKYGPYCNKIAMNILANHEDCEECLSDTLLRAWGAMPPSRPNCLRTFLGKITRNIALDRFESAHAQKRGGSEIPLILDELAECTASETDTEKEAEAMELSMLINSWLADCSEKERKIFLRRYWFCDSVNAIAERYSVGESYVKTSLYRSRRSLKNKLKEEGYII